MHEILKIADRDPVVIYNNPLYLKVFDNDKFNCELFDIQVPKYGYNFSFAIITVKKAPAGSLMLKKSLILLSN